MAHLSLFSSAHYQASSVCFQSVMQAPLLLMSMPVGLFRDKMGGAFFDISEATQIQIENRKQASREAKEEKKITFPTAHFSSKVVCLDTGISCGAGPRIKSLWPGWRKRCPLSVGANGRLFPCARGRAAS
eukprot:926700-Pelagomonas_calceolata.AAC.1